MNRAESVAAPRIRVLIVDDHPVVREGLQSLLSQYPDIDIIGSAGDDSAAMGIALSLKPDVILLDIKLGDLNGLEFARRLKRQRSPACIIILTAYDDPTYLTEAAMLNVHGYLLKDTCQENLAEAIRAAHGGERQISPSMANVAFEELGTVTRKHAQATAQLSDQELSILKLIAEGTNTYEIAQGMFVSERTVKRQIQEILSKLGAVNRAQAVAECFKRGLL